MNTGKNGWFSLSLNGRVPALRLSRVLSLETNSWELDVMADELIARTLPDPLSSSRGGSPGKATGR
jgi:hypothetical protein